MADDRGEIERRLIERADDYRIKFRESIDSGSTEHLLRKSAELLGECRRAMRRVHDELAAAAADFRKAYQPSPTLWAAGRANGLREILAKLEGGRSGGDQS